MAFSIMSLGLFVFQMFPGELLGLFSASETMCALGIPALRRISLCFLPAAFGILASGLFGAMGDHRSVSIDSRKFGCIKQKDIVGQAVFRLYSFNKIGVI